MTISNTSLGVQDHSLEMIHFTEMFILFDFKVNFIPRM